MGVTYLRRLLHHVGFHTGFFAVRTVDNRTFWTSKKYDTVDDYKYCTCNAVKAIWK